MSSQWDFLFLMFALFLDVMASQEHLFKANVEAQRLIGVLNHPWFKGLYSTRLSLVKGNALERLHFVCQYMKTQLSFCSHLFKFLRCS